ncbi:hypothetical protein [Aquifex aeolicus]|uniref:Uncharacterized protein aq_194 n=1 Tax=Aquifex aeolicus (strain VF5) TaxID=224324 RepID=Y194_AQUAE|nr:hypothetical protein [Aquifex aeolicus]O66575.1 RecName: Full=Uncharacterized protein aq_194 [Aquifex aeolicus VF5]AAC06532.1 putative protein [Aquifex aeolicus VF5]
MEFFFFIDVYADRELVDYYIVTFKLDDLSSVELTGSQGKYYIRGIRDWEKFKEEAYDITLYELGDEVDRFKDIETALREAYRIAIGEAVRRGAKNIVPAIGFGNPPPEVVERVYPEELKFEKFPEDLDAFLDRIVKEVSLETTERSKDDDEIPF